MSQRHLIALDISGSYIGGPEINALLKNGSPCRLSLETLACSHLPLIGSSLSYILDHAVNLKQLDMRGVMKTEDQRIRKDVARGVFELAIFEPHEQLGFGDKAVCAFCFIFFVSLELSFCSVYRPLEVLITILVVDTMSPGRQILKEAACVGRPPD